MEKQFAAQTIRALIAHGTDRHGQAAHCAIARSWREVAGFAVAITGAKPLVVPVQQTSAVVDHMQ